MSRNSRGYGAFYVKEAGTTFFIHRLVWIYHNGYIPVNYQIDHIDRDKDNNRIENLMLVTCRENMKNRPCGTSGVKGVSWNKHVGKFQARITVNGSTKSLGYSDDLEVAKALYQKAEMRPSCRQAAA